MQLALGRIVVFDRLDGHHRRTPTGTISIAVTAGAPPIPLSTTCALNISFLENVAAPGKGLRTGARDG